MRGLREKERVHFLIMEDHRRGESGSSRHHGSREAKSLALAPRGETFQGYDESLFKSAEDRKWFNYLK